jgi:Heparinase II/III-like protein.
MINYTFKEIRDAITAVKELPRTLLGREVDQRLLLQLAEYPHLKPLFEEARADADIAKKEPFPELRFSAFRLFASQGTRIEYETPYFERRSRFISLMLVVLLEQERSDMEALEDLIWEICAEYTWCFPAHLPMSPDRIPPRQRVDLFAAETAQALAEAVYLLGDRLDQQVADRVRAEVEDRIFQPYFESSAPFIWESSMSNWAAVCSGAAGMAAILLVDDRERLAGMTARVISAMNVFLSGFEEDGCCTEGIVYWTYGFGFFFYYADMLYEFTSGAIDLLRGEKIRKMASFPAAVQLSPDQYVSFSDASLDSEPHTGLLCRLNRRLGQPLPRMERVPRLYLINRWTHASRNVFWSDAGLLNGPMAQGTFLFPDACWAINKAEHAGAQFSLACKGGHNDEPHNHNDLGHFILNVNGEMLLADLGAGVYTKDYFNDKRYEHIHNASEGHSVPIVNGIQQAAGRSHYAELVCREEAGGRLEAEIDLTSAYPAESGLTKLTRSFVWRLLPDKPEAEFSLVDDFSFRAANNRVEELFMSLHRPEIDHGRIIWQGERSRAVLAFDAGLLHAETEAIDSHMHNSDPVRIYRVRLTARGLGAEARIKLSFTLTAAV